MPIQIIVGSVALAAFRIDKLLAELVPVNSDEQSIGTLLAHYEFVLDLSAPLSALDATRVAELLGGTGAEPSGDVLRIGPRSGAISPWSSKATNIFAVAGVNSVRRVERLLCYKLQDQDGAALTWGGLSTRQRNVLHDRMTQASWSFDQLQELFAEHPPGQLRSIELGADPLAVLANANSTMGLALNDAEVRYLASAYSAIGRAPTDVELMMFAQANSEHCRHKIFNAEWTVDGQEQERSLFSMVRHTFQQANGEGILSAYSDNASVVAGSTVARAWYAPDSRELTLVDEPVHMLMKVETHNHPTGISPYPGAATGSGGEIRDEGAVGRGSKPKAGLTGFTVSHLELPALPQPWELDYGRPERLASALDIMLDGPIGAASFNNEFGRPALTGYFRTLEVLAPVVGADNRHEVRGYLKPVMLAGGLGNVRTEHVNSLPVPPGSPLVVLGGPAMLIGLGGGAASSMATGTSDEALDFASVQRENPEMQRRAQEVIDRCCALGENNPILLIHDVGAGGLSNALPRTHR